jgi:pyruvate dehydrogenase E1 component alpha subunit
MQRDPVDIARKTLIDWGVLDAAAADALEEEARAEVNAAFEWAAEQPLCRPEDGLKHVFAEGEVLPRQIA